MMSFQIMSSPDSLKYKYLKTMQPNALVILHPFQCSHGVSRGQWRLDGLEQ